jgi:hypothetical protein
MTWPQGGDPYGQQQQPGGYDPYAQPQSAQPYSGQPYSGQPYSGQPYQQGPYYPPPQATGTNTMAILSLVFAFVLAPLAIVFGHMAKGQIKRTGEDGDGLATAGLVLGYVFTGLGVLGLCLGVGLPLFGLALCGGAASTSGTSSDGYTFILNAATSAF